jgi:uncharacterized protein DUF6084
MPELKLSIEDAHHKSAHDQRGLALRLHLAIAPAPTHVYSLALSYDVQIAAARRHYTPGEQRRLVGLFGPIGIWYQTLHALPWSKGTVQVPAFIGETSIELSLPCGSDADSAIKKYFQALSDGDAPLAASFSGAAFCASDNLPLQTCSLPEDCRTTFRLPLSLWTAATQPAWQAATDAA